MIGGVVLLIQGDTSNSLQNFLEGTKLSIRPMGSWEEESRRVREAGSESQAGSRFVRCGSRFTERRLGELDREEEDQIVPQITMRSVSPLAALECDPHQLPGTEQDEELRKS
ncbi:hypothetical protein Q8A67_019457 [Cirrhinus molitorella]|uniref:Uncharacterized protein n=1 Tax=Cirrhinus molitorella TaxID=172907 RepID=A0AA88TGE4_9TELE|nr:hypothetical protein Q8A67_019457 [Cirrhinus molitorella]